MRQGHLPPLSTPSLPYQVTIKLKNANSGSISKLISRTHPNPIHSTLLSAALSSPSDLLTRSFTATPFWGQLQAQHHDFSLTSPVPASPFASSLENEFLWSDNPPRQAVLPWWISKLARFASSVIPRFPGKKQSSTASHTHLTDSDLELESVRDLMELIAVPGEKMLQENV